MVELFSKILFYQWYYLCLIYCNIFSFLFCKVYHRIYFVLYLSSNWCLSYSLSIWFLVWFVSWFVFVISKSLYLLQLWKGKDQEKLRIWTLQDKYFSKWVTIRFLVWGYVNINFINPKKPLSTQKCSFRWNTYPANYLRQTSNLNKRLLQLMQQMTCYCPWKYFCLSVQCS